MMPVTAAITRPKRIMTTDTETPIVTLLRLQSWLSPAFPTGAFSYSHGLESAVEDGLVADAGDLTTWLTGMLRYGAGRTDAWLLIEAFDTAAERDSTRLVGVAELARALSGASELSMETRVQGTAFLKTVRAAWPMRTLDWAVDTLDAAEIPATLPIAAGIAGAAHGLALEALAPLYLNGLVAHLVSAGVRLIPLGQTDGQRVIAALEPIVTEAATRALRRDEASPAGATLMVDFCAMRHETQYSRLFRS